MAKNRQIFAIVKATLFALVLSFSSLNAFSGNSCDFYLSNNSENCVVKCGAGYIVRQQGGNACITLNSLQNDALIEYMVISGYFNFLRKYPEYQDWSLYTAARSYLQKSGSTIKDLLYSSDHFVPIKPSGEDVCPVDSYKDLMKLNFVDDCKSDPSVGTSFWYMIHPNSMTTSGDGSVKYSIYDTPILDYKYNTNGTVDLKGNIFVLNEAVEDQVKAGVTDVTELPPIALCPMGTKLTGVDKYVTSCNGVDTGASYDIIIYTDQTPFINAGITAGFGMDRFILREVFGKGWTAVIEDKNGVLEEIVLADYSNTSGIAQDKSLFYTYDKEIPLRYPAALGLQDMLNAMFLAYEEFFTDQLGKDVKFNQTDKDAIINNFTKEKELHEMLNSSTFGRSTRLHANILYNTAKSSEITYDNIPHHTSLKNFQCNSNCSGVEDTGNKEKFDNYPEGGGEESTSTTITLNWNENGGNAITNGSCTYGSNLTLPSAPTRSGHTFNGWKLANGTIKGANTTVSGGCTSTYTGVSSGTSTYITAQWTASGGTGGGFDEPAAGEGQCNMQIDNPGCEGDICMNNYKNTGFLQQENQWCYANNYYFTDNNEYINPYTSIKNGTSGINYWSNSENDFVSLDVFHGEHEIDLEASVLWENNHSFLSAGTTQIENKDDMGEYYELLNNIYNGNSDYDNTFVLPDLPYCDGYVFNGYDVGYDGAGVFVSCSGQTLTANYTSLDGTITIGSNSYELEHLSNIAPLALNLEEDPDATYRFVCDSSLYVLDYCNNQYVRDYLENIHHSENEHEYAYISPLAVFMMAYEVPSSGSYFSGDCGGQTLMECFGISSSDGNLPNGGSLYDYSRESVEEFMKMVFEYDNWGFGVGGNSPQFAPDSRQYHLMKLANQYGIMGQNMVFENLGSGSGGGSTTPTTTTITLNWNENGGNAIANGSCTYGSNLTLPSAPTRDGYTFSGWKLADNSTHNVGETITGGCTDTYTGVSSGTSTYIVAQWTECGTGYYCQNGVKTQCPESYPNTDSDTVSSAADCYSVKTATCIKQGCVNPDSTGCNVVCADCSCAGSTYKQYANSDGTGDGVTEGNTIESCTKQISSLSAKPGYYVNGTSGCPICPEGYRDGTNAQNIYQCYGNSAVNCEDYYNIANAQTPYAPQSATCKMYYGSPTCVLNNKNACNISSLSCQNGYELTERDFDTSNPSLEYVKVKNTIVDNCYYENFSTQTNSSNCSDSSIFGTLNPGSWEVKNELGVIKGTAGCSETGGTAYQSGNPTITDSGNHCWCRIEKLNGETALSQWVYAGSDSSCTTNCQSICGVYGFAFLPQEFRESLYSTVSQTCEEQTIIHCDAGWYLPAGQTQCVKCDGSSSTPSYQNIIKNDWCEGGDFQFSATDDQGLRACPTINDNTGAFSYELQYLGGSEHLDSDKNGMKDKITDCVASFMYTQRSEMISGIEEASSYNNNSELNTGTALSQLICFYDQTTGRYDNCILPTYVGAAYCNAGYKIKQSVLNAWTPLVDNSGNFVDGAYSLLIDMLSDPINPCELGEANHYTNLYDLLMASGDENSQQYADKFGVVAYHGHLYSPISDDLTNDITEMYKSCPTAYPNSNAGSWKVAQCYATVTFKDGNTVLRTENHDFDGSSDGVTITSNPYHISDYEPTKAGYEFAGWYEESSGDSVTTSTDLTGNKTLYARWLIKCPVVDNSSFGALYITGDTGYAESLDDCHASFVYANNANNSTSAISGQVLSVDYNANNNINQAVYSQVLSCKYNTSTALYDLCAPATLNVICAKGYYIGNPEYELSLYPNDYLTGVSNGFNDEYVVYPHRTPCVPGQRGYYTTIYDKAKGTEYETLAGGFIPNTGVAASTFGTTTVGVPPTNMFTDLVDLMQNYMYYPDQSRSYKKCPDAYPDSEPASWQVAQCYATVTFKDGNTVLRTENHDFSGSSDGTTVTSNPYHISNYEPTKANYTFAGWHEESSGDSVTTSTDLMGNKTLSAEWRLTSCGAGEYKNGDVCATCPEGFREGANASTINDCYGYGTTTCSAIENVSNGTGYYGDTSIPCTRYYGNQSVCTPNGSYQCPMFDITCNPGYSKTGVGLTSVDTGITTSNTRYYSIATVAGQSSSNTSGMERGDWDATFTYGTVKGKAICSSTNGSFGNAGSPNTTSGTKKYCWCDTTGFVPASPNAEEQEAQSAWMFSEGYTLATTCSISCAKSCATAFSGSSGTTMRANTYSQFSSLTCEIETYNIIYYLDDGIVSEANPETYNVETATFTLNNPTKTNYTFAGWCEGNADCANPALTYTITQGTTGNKSLYAKWTSSDVYCDPGYYLPANEIECVGCQAYAPNVADNVWCPGGWYHVKNEIQGLRECPAIQNYGGAGSVKPVYSIVFGDIDYNNNHIKDLEEDCGAEFIYSYDINNVGTSVDSNLSYSAISSENLSSGYNANSDYNKNIAWALADCTYNPDTGLYDRCFPSDIWIGTVCKNGYYVPQTKIHTNVSDLHDYIGEFDTEICMPASAGYYTNVYDLHKNDDTSLADKIGLSTSMLTGAYLDAVVNSSANFSDLYKKCPDEYPNSESASWQVAQCYSTVTFKDGNTVLNTEQHDFSGSSDGVTVTSNPYHITSYTPNVPTDYRFDGWFREITLETPVTTSTDLTGDVDLYAKFTLERCSAGQYKEDNICKICPEGFRDGSDGNSIADCYGNDTMSCEIANPYTGTIGSAIHNKSTTSCKRYYNNQSVCVPDNATDCMIVALSCPNGYEQTGTSLSTMNLSLNANSTRYLSTNTLGLKSSDTTGLENHEWDATFDYGTVKGTSLCSTDSASYGEVGTPSTDSGKNCWCQAQEFTPVSYTNVETQDATSLFVFNYASTTSGTCDNYCPSYCAAGIGGIGQTNWTDDVRVNAFNSTQPLQCSPITYTISYDLDSGTVSGTNPETYNIETSTFTVINPTKANYEFVGWCEGNANCVSPALTYTITQGTTGNKSLYAKWELVTIHCDPGWFLPAGQTQCVQCTHGFIEEEEDFWCNGGDFYISTENQGLQACPSINDNTGAAYYRSLSWNYLDGLDPDKNDVKDKITDCAAGFMYTRHPELPGIIPQEAETYNPNSELNVGTSTVQLICFYNQATGRYDKCVPPNVNTFLSVCDAGYKIKQSVLDVVAPLIDNNGNLVDGAENTLMDMLGSPINPCELGEANHYTSLYDALILSDDEDTRQNADKIGVVAYQGHLYSPISGVFTNDITEMYKSCPTEYPSSEAGSWKVAQCYATVTFKDGDTVLRTENHDFSGSSDGTTVTSNPYHISNYEPTKDGYEFAGWYENADFSGNPITTSTDLTGNKTLYAKWDFYYRIGFNNNYIPGVTGSMDTIFVPYSQEITLPANQYSAPGYDFAGWCYAGEESGTVSGNPVSGFECMNNNKIDYVDEASVVSLTEYSTKDHYPYGIPIIKLYAQWTPHHYSIVFNANGGTGNMENQEFAYGTNQNLDANQFTKSGYEFAGWCTTQECADGDGHTIYSDEQSVGNLTTEDGAEINLYAQWTQNTFYIKYYSEGSELTEIMPDSYTYSDEDDQEFTPTEPTRSGFVFDGWCRNEDLTDCSDTITIDAGTTGTVNVYVKWLRQITIHFDENTTDETVTNIPENIVCTEGEVCTVVFQEGSTNPVTGFSTKPYRIGHRFVSWNSDSEGQDASFEYEFQKMVTANTRQYSADLSGVFDLTDGDEITLYAQWDPETYNIKYYSDDSELNNIPQNTYAYNSSSDQVITPDEPTKANYEFVGWCDNSGLTGDCSKTITVPAGTTGEITVYAKWLLVSCGNGEYKGDNVCELCPEGFREGTNAQNINECYRSCTTANVLYSVNVTGLDYYDEGADTCEPTACENGYHVQDIASIIGQTWGGGYAHVNNSGEVRDGYMGSPYDTSFDDYEYHDATYYDLNTNDHNSFAVSFGNKGVIRGHARCTTTDGTIDYASYRFSTETSIKDEAGQIGARHCWCDLDGYRENNGTTWHNLYSNWIATYSMGGNSAEAAASGCAEYCVDQCTDVLSISDDDLPVYRATLFGSTKNICAPDVYNVTYEVNGGTAIDSVEYTYGSPAITLPQPTRDNYAFVGWYSDSELQTFVGNTGDSYTPTESVTLYAQWSENTYGIKYYSDGVELNNIPQNTYTYNSSEDQTITPNEPVKANYEFVGWCDNSDLNGDCPKTITIPAGANGELHLYAKWEVGNFTITYELDGGAAENITSYTVETDDFVLNNPIKTGYVFQGWCEELHCAHPEHDYTFHTSVGGNRTMYAVFEPIQYTIEFNGTGAEGYKFAVTCEYDKNCDISNNGDFVYEGYDFVGWATTQNATVPQYPQTPTGITVFNLTDTPQTFMLYAMWSAKNIDLTYVYHNDADTVYSTSCVFDESVLPVVPVRPGFRFVGWRVNVGLDTLTQEQCTSAGFNWCVNGNGGVCQQNACM